jgi:Rieske Fe-S protein
VFCGKLAAMDKPTAVKNLSALSRRRFVKTFALGTAASVVGGQAWRGSVLAGILPTGASGQLRVKLSDYPALANSPGSVRIAINPVVEELEANELLGPFYPVLINHLNGTYYAMTTQCRHEGCIVPVFLECIGCIECQCHLSRYAIDGSLLNGPSTSPLEPYPVVFDGVDTLTITVPNLGYNIETALVQIGNTPRLRLHFFGFMGVEYEVYFRETLSQPWVVIPFSLTPDGTANQLSYTGEYQLGYENGSPASLYVNRTTGTGFYSVGIKTSALEWDGYFGTYEC